MKRLLTALLFAILSFQRLPGALFENLPAKDRIRISYTSTGCFHYITYEFDFQRSDTLTAAIVRLDEKRIEGSKKRIVKRVPQGTVKISEKQAKGLDRLIEFYRQKQEGGCTTVDNITITHRSPKGIVSKESFVDRTCRAENDPGITLLSDVVALLSPTPLPPRVPPPDRAVELQKASEKCRDLPGYEQLSTEFKIGEAISGRVNGDPESLFVKLTRTDPATIDAAWWWNPLKNGTPSLSWDDYLKAYAAAETRLSHFPWLGKWKALSGKRSVELHLHGTRAAESDGDFATYVLPLWKHAKMAGQPTVCVLARRNNGSWIEFYFSDEDERALVRSAQGPDPGASCAIDRLDLSWHPRSKAGEKFSQYAVIESDGKCVGQTFVVEP